MQADAQAAYDRREEELTPEVMRDLERRVILSVLGTKWRKPLSEMDYLPSGIHMRGHAQRDPLIEYQREGFELFTAMMDAIKEDSVGNLFNLVLETQQYPISGEMGPDGEWLGQQLGAVGDQLPVVLQLPDAGDTGAGAGGAGAGSVVAGGAVGSASGPDDAIPAAFIPRGLAQPKRPSQLNYSAPSDDASGRAVEKAGSASAADFSKVGRNEPCPCGSGKKFKLCHGDPRKR